MRTALWVWGFVAAFGGGAVVTIILNYAVTMPRLALAGCTLGTALFIVGLVGVSKVDTSDVNDRLYLRELRSRLTVH